MPRFLIRLTLYTAPLFITMMIIFLSEGGFSDPFYLRFTTNKQPALIIGTSRSAQGLIPSIINRGLKGYYEHPIYNYSFTVTHSPFGSVYFESIKNKLANVTNGLFIVTVDPWMISAVLEEPNNEALFSENDTFLSEVKNVSCNPNFEYLFDFYPEPYYKIILKRLNPGPLRLHSDGWAEVSVKMDSITIRKRSNTQFKRYGSKAEKIRFSAKRFFYLQETIEMLRKHGDVFLIRLPVRKEMAGIENAMMVDFSEKIQVLKDKYDIPYLDMTHSPTEYRFTDGHHLHKSSSKTVSEEVTKWIIGIKKDISITATSQ